MVAPGRYVPDLSGLGEKIVGHRLRIDSVQLCAAELAGSGQLCVAEPAALGGRALGFVASDSDAADSDAAEEADRLVDGFVVA